jgi:hypothetical protein
MSPFADGSAKASRSDNDPVFDLIVEKVARGECTLFLGSAVHSPPPILPDILYPKAKRPAIGSELSLMLAAKSKFSDKFANEDAKNLQRVSLYYEMILTRNQLVKEVKELVHDDKEPSPMLELLARLKFPLVITTNYDQLFEKAIQGVGKEFSRCVYKPVVDRPHLERQYFFSADASDAVGLSRRRQNINDQHPLILKIHGDVVEDSSSIVITDEDYIQFVLRMGERGKGNPVPKAVLEKLKTWSTLFIGYSLKDYNLRLLFKTLRWKIDKADIPPMYSIDLRPDPLIFAYWDNHQRYVTFLVKNLWEFIPRLYAKVPDEHKIPLPALLKE